MSLISSLAMWLSINKGSLIIEWFGWQITTTPSFFLICLIFSIFMIYIISSLIFNLFNLPKNLLKRIKKNNINKAKLSLENGIIASFYGNKNELSKNLKIAKKFLNNTPLLKLLEFQDSIYNRNDKASFYILTKMLEIDKLKPLAIKGLLTYSAKNQDKELFSNILYKSLDKKIDFSWIMKDIFNFCIKNNNWEELSIYLEKKVSPNSKKYREILSIVYYQISIGYYLLKEISSSKLYLNKALKLNNNFPPFMELYCKLKIAKNDKELMKILKNYWAKTPNPNIEKCIEVGFPNQNSLSRIRTISKILLNNDHLYYKYLILGKYKYKAKIWGASTIDLEKSITFKPSKDAYYLLCQIGKDLKYNKEKSDELKNLYNTCKDIYFWRCISCNVLYHVWQPYCKSCKDFGTIKMLDNNGIYSVSNSSQLLSDEMLL